MHDYYRQKKNKLMKDTVKSIELIKPYIRKDYHEKAEKICAEVLKLYEIYIDEFPYIGGDKNPLTRILLHAGWGIALYEVLKPLGGTAYESGEYLIKGVEIMMKKYPKWLMRLMGKFYISKLMLKKKKKRALESQKRRYSEDWVYKIENGTADTKFIQTYVECGLDKFCKKRNVPEFTPYLCNLDYLTFKNLGIPLYRTKSIGCGDKECDFHIQCKGKCPDYWPPQFLNKGKLK